MIVSSLCRELFELAQSPVYRNGLCCVEVVRARLFLCLTLKYWLLSIVFMKPKIAHQCFFALLLSSLACTRFTAASEHPDESAKSDWIEKKDEALAVQRAQQEALQRNSASARIAQTDSEREEAFNRWLGFALRADKASDWSNAKKYYELAIQNSNFVCRSEIRVMKILMRLPELCKLTGQSYNSDEYLRLLSDATGRSSFDDFRKSGILTSSNLRSQLLIADKLVSSHKLVEAEEYYLFVSQAKHDLKIDSLVKATVADRLVRLHLAQDLLDQAAKDIGSVPAAALKEYSIRKSEDTESAMLSLLSAQACLANYSGEFEKSREITKNCLGIIEKSRFPNKYRHVVVLADRAKSYELDNDFQTAATYYDRALQVAAKEKPLNMIYQRPIMFALAECYKKLGRIDRASALLKRANSDELH